MPTISEQYFSRLMNNLRVRLPGALDGAIQMEMFNVIDDMCRTVDFIFTVSQTNLVVNTSTYYVTPPVGTVPISFYKLAHETYPMTRAFVSPDEGSFTLLDPVTAEHAATPVAIKMTFAPDPAAAPEQWVPEFFWGRGYAVILNGVLAAMMASPAKPYSNTQLALFHARKYRHGKSGIKIINTTGNAPEGHSWQFPRI
jgi:hypothetical protein